MPAYPYARGYGGYGREDMHRLAANSDGSTDDGALLFAAQAVLGLSDPCRLDAGGLNQTVQSFQQAWNNTTDSAMGSPKLTEDGQYGPKTAAALLDVFGGPNNSQGVNVPAGCTSYTGGGIGVGPRPPGPPTPQPPPTPPPAPPGGVTPVPPPGTIAKTGPVWAKWVVGLLAVGAIVFLGWVVTHKPRARAKGVKHRAGEAQRSRRPRRARRPARRRR